MCTSKLRKRRNFMNFKKVAFIPLMALLLVGCNANNGGKKGGSSSGQQGSDIVEPDGEAVTLDQTKSALSQSATALLAQNNIGFDLTSSGIEAKYFQKTYAETMGFMEMINVEAAVSDVSLKVRAENLLSQNLDQDFKASIEAGLGVVAKLKMPTGVNETTGELQYATMRVNGNLEASAYLVGNEPYVNVPASNKAVIDQVVELLTTLGAIDEAPEIPELPIKYHLTNTGLSLNGIMEGKEQVVPAIEGFAEELAEAPEFVSLKYIKESETLYAIYAEINFAEPNTANVNETVYLLSESDVKAKVLLEFDTVKGLKSLGVEAEVLTYTTYASRYLPTLEGELPETMTKEILETRIQETRVKGQAQARFCYGENAKANIPTDLNSYVDMPVNAEPSGDEGQGEGQGE